jgi:pimeloyl-ACP methyl ester carboxylesterase
MFRKTLAAHFGKYLFGFSLLIIFVAFSDFNVLGQESDPKDSAKSLALSGTTPPFLDEQGKILTNSVALLEKIQLGGIEQYVLIRGKDKSKPIVLFLHGGPGMPMMYLAHSFQKELEKHFIVVHWDRCGAGKSYSEDIPPETMTVKQMISDTKDLVEILRSRFNKKKIYLVGHSWGTYLGMLVVQNYPQFFEAYIGIGQLAYFGEENVKIQDEFIRRKAIETKNNDAIIELEKQGANVREKWLFQFGGELYNATSFQPLVNAGMQSPEYTFADVTNISKGSSFVSKNMKYDAIEGNLIDEVLDFKIPIYFFLGRYDYTTPFELAEKYFKKLKAPEKTLVWFENSAHFAFFEEPEKFTVEMIKIRKTQTK